MAIAFVQSKEAHSYGTNRTVTFTSNVTAGNDIIVSHGFWDEKATPHTPTISDNLGNTYNLVDTISNEEITSSYLVKLTVWRATGVTGGACTITIGTGSSHYQCVAAHEYSGIVAADSVAKTTGTSTAPASGSVTVQNANELIFTTYSHKLSLATSDPPASFTMRENQLNGTSYMGLSTADLVPTSSSTNPTFSMDVSGRWSALSASFSPTSITPATWFPFKDKAKRPKESRQERRLPGIVEKIYTSSPVLPTPVLPGYTPPPAPAIIESTMVPFLARDPTATPRLRRFTEIVSQIINSLIEQGYLRQVGPYTWTVTGTPGGVVSFNTRVGAITLNANDINAAFGTQAPTHFYAGPEPSFRFIATNDLPSDVTDSLISVVWGSPGSETGNAIEIQATCQNLKGGAFASAFVDVEIIVSDSATDHEPSATATLAAAGTPVGTVLGGSGTATMVIRTDATGAFKVKVTETAIAYRYLWVKQNGNARMWVRSATGVQELIFT